MEKRRYIARKLLNALLIVFLVGSFNFFLFRILPGDPARLLLPHGVFDPQAVAQQRKAFDLDKPMDLQFVYYWRNVVVGQLGNSYLQKRPVTQVVGEAIVPTLVLVGTGTIIAMLIGVSGGVLAGWRRNRAFDVAFTNSSIVTYSMPTFWLGMILIVIFAVKLGWFPTGRMSDPGAVYSGSLGRSFAYLHHLFLPAVVLGLVWAGQYAVITRSSVIGTMREDYVLTARAKGNSTMRVLWRHVVPNALLPTVTLIMMNFGFVLSGAILTETVFNWPGLGLLSYNSMLNRDYPVMQVIFLLAAAAVIVCNLIADIMYCYLDPRVKA